MSKLASAALVTGVLLAIGGTLVGGLTAMEHRSARVEYEAQSALLETGGSGYDGRRSDALYEAALGLVVRGERAGWLAALGWVLIALGVGMPRERRLAALLDVGLVFGLVAAHFYVESWLGAGWAALGSHLASQVVGMALGWAWLRLRLTSTAA